MLLQPSKVLPVGEQWLYTSTRLYSRNAKDLTSRFPPIIHVVQALPVKFCILDGEIVCLDELGRFVWLKPKVKAAVQYQEWTRAGFLRHAKLRDFSGLDK